MAVAHDAQAPPRRSGPAGRGRRGAALLLAAALGTGCVAPPLTPVVIVASPEAGFSAAIERSLPYTVGVYRSGDASAPASRGSADAELLTDVSLGAGIVIDGSGLIATAAHVVAGSDPVVVRLPDERVLPATRLGVDADTDLALLKVDAHWDAPPPLGHSMSLRPGDWVIAIGEPYGLERSVMAGIVGGANRHFADDDAVLFIQTSITVNPGNSGGPLVDARGAIVGMNLRAVVSPLGMAGLGLALPIELVLQIAAELQHGAAARRPRLGALFEDVLPPEALAAGLARSSGAMVRLVRPEGAAMRVGLRVGDIVVGMNGRPVGGGAELARLLLEWHAGEPLRLTVFREGGYRELRQP